MCIYLKDNPAKFHHDPKFEDVAQQEEKQQEKQEQDE